jgi:hypothetical protein
MTDLSLFFASFLMAFGLQAQPDSLAKKQKERLIQVSLITPLGTNGMESLDITNKISINILAGGSGGVNGVEGAGFANLTMKDVKGVQGAGFANVVLGNVHGCQMAGFTNVSMGDLKGAQLAGFLNVNEGTMKGVQGAGFVNYNQKDVTGLQGAGFANVTLGNHKGAQLSGFANYTNGDMEGLQASGFFNYAKKVKGVQLGFLNIADSVDGASIGFLSFVKKGLHQVEVSADELFYTNVSIRTGGCSFYNVFSSGFSPSGGTTLWQIGYGAGTSFRINEKMRADVMAIGHHVSKGLFYNGTSELYRLYIGVEYKLANKCYIAAGPTFNLYLGDTILPDYASKYSNIGPYTILNETNSEGFNYKGWVGGKIAIRFL